MAKLQDFTSIIKKNGLMRTARYTVEMGRPEIMSKFNYSPIDTETIAILCDQVQVPGLNYSTTANLSYGETREIPYTRLYDHITMSFYVDNDMLTKKYFDDWLLSIQNPVTRTFNYYNQYTTDIIIRVEDLNNESPYAVKLFECYPKNISAITLDYSTRDVMKLSLTMAYKYWTSEFDIRKSYPVDFFNVTQPEFQSISTGITQ